MTRDDAPSVAVIGTRGYPSYYGGFETAVRKLAPHLADAGWDVTVYGRHGSTRDDDPQRDRRVRSVRTRGLESKSLSTLSYGLSASIAAAVRRPDVALVMNVANGFFLPLLKARRVPTVVNVDGIEWDRAKWGRLARLIFKLGARWTARHADELVFDSLEIERRWNMEFDRSGTFIPYGGDVPTDLPVMQGLRHRDYVLVVARFVPENTIGEFLGAVERIAQETSVVIVGTTGYGGAFDDEASRLAAESECVHWLGHVSDDALLLSLWLHAGVYFHGHSVGGTNPTLVQAMAAGAPIVARDTVYNREVLGDAGRFCAPTSDAIATAVLELLRDEAATRRSSQRASERSRMSYTWEGVCRDYRDLLARTRRRQPL